jgi:uncharacterized membrane protein YbhN (UPF0104 family)
MADFLTALCWMWLALAAFGALISWHAYLRLNRDMGAPTGIKVKRRPF